MLVEREARLAALAAALDDAVAGHGRLIFVGGEAGVGKTSLVTAAAGEAGRRVSVRRGVVDHVTTPSPLGSVIDAVPELSDVLDAAAEVSRQDVLRRLQAVLSGTPAMVVLEDLHWADAATFDLLGRLARRLERLPVLMIGTYRTDDVAPSHPLALLMGDLATTAGVQRLSVEPLSPAAVGALVLAAGSPIDPAQLHARTGGNAFFVTEVLAAGGDELPGTVRDAVLARVTRLSEAARDVLAAAAVLGQPVDAQLLATVANRAIEGVDECVASGLLVADPDGWRFRHELARLAVEQTLSPATVADLNGRAHAALLGRGVDDDRRLAHHAAVHGDRPAVGRHAVRAAQRAARLGAHKEAAEHYRLALRFHDGDPATRAQLLEALSYECYLVDALAEALSARLKAMELAELGADPQAQGRQQRWVSRLSWFLGRNADSERYAARAVATLEPHGDGHELAMAYSNRSQLAMLSDDWATACDWGERAIALARRIGDREAETHALNNVGVAGMAGGDQVAGRTSLHRSLDLALADDAHEHAARAYTNLGTLMALGRDLVGAESALRAGIAYCIERDLDAWRLYMGAQLARVVAERGRYDEAVALADDVLRHPRVSPVTRFVASTVRAQIMTRRGHEAAGLLDEGWAFALGTGEVQRLLPAAVARAEAAWLAGRADEIGAVTEPAWAAASAHPTPWEVGEISHWREAAGLPPPVEPVAAPFALAAAGHWQAAADAWEEIGCPLWRALCLARVPTLDAARDAFAVLDALDAPAVQQAIGRDRRAAGLPVPRGPRPAGRDNPAALTARELEVLELLVDGLSNAQIASALSLSEKTVGHHVSAVLRKLDEPTRARAVAAAHRLGIVAAGAAAAPPR